ncbi:MAG: hypothetical protein WCK42_09580 [Myxococcaceae bacterium]
MQLEHPQTTIEAPQISPELSARIDTATHVDIERALARHHADFAEATTSFATATAGDGFVKLEDLNEHVIDGLGLRATNVMLQEWKALDEADRPNFQDYVRSQENALQWDADGNAAGSESNRRRSDVMNANDWIEERFARVMTQNFEDSDMGIPIRKPDRLGTLGSENFQLLEAELARRQQAWLDKSREEGLVEQIDRKNTLIEARQKINEIHREPQATDTEADQNTPEQIARRILENAITIEESNLLQAEASSLFPHNNPGYNENDQKRIKEIDEKIDAGLFTSTDPVEFGSVLRHLGFSNEVVEAKVLIMKNEIAKGDSMTPPIFSINYLLENDGTSPVNFHMAFQKTTRPRS